jgi:uncharacterized membrane protein
MALTDLYTNLHLLFRWLHVIAGITWIGMLYFFNFVNVPLQGVLDDAAKKAVNPQLMPRALWWFRWGAMTTFLAGWVLFSMIYMYQPETGWGPNQLFRDETGLTDKAVWILVGMTLGTIMWFNVWFVIWPTQKKLLSGQVPPEKIADERKKAGLFSRINTFLSGPMLFGMLAANHYGAVNLFTVLLFCAVGAAGIWVAIFHTTKVGHSV